LLSSNCRVTLGAEVGKMESTDRPDSCLLVVNGIQAGAAPPNNNDLLPQASMQSHAERNK
jgi:hypothetical protein